MKTTSVFRSLTSYNYRIWMASAMVSNIGTWMQRTAQDWLVLTILTDNDALAVGIVMSLQFGPPILLLPFTGLVADRFDRRKILMVTQGVRGALGLALGLLTVTGAITLWQVYVFAGLLGCATAFDSPTRQVFVSSLVSRRNLSNAVALNSTSFNMARMLGPAIAGVLIAAVGTGWMFIINAATFVAVFFALTSMRTDQMRDTDRSKKEGDGGLVQGIRYVWNRPDILVLMVMVFLFGTFGLNFPIFISTMATVVFHQGAEVYGLLSSILAIGSVTGALLAAKRERPGLALLLAAAGAFGIGCTLAALMPGLWWFALCLILVGIAAQTLTTGANSVVQLSTAPHVRGRVMALYTGVFMGGTPIGAPIVGWVANEFGPRWALGVGAAAGLACVIVGLVYLVRHRQLRVHYRRWRPIVTYSSPDAAYTDVTTNGIEVQRDGTV